MQSNNYPHKVFDWKPYIKVIGIGYTGESVINYMIEYDLNDADLIAINHKDELRLKNNLHTFYESEFNIIICNLSEANVSSLLYDISKMSHSYGILTIVIATFDENLFEYRHENILQKIVNNSDSIIIIPNVKECHASLPTTSQQFYARDKKVVRAIRSLICSATKNSIIAHDFTDIRTITSVKGIACFGEGSASGENRVIKAVQNALRDLQLNEFQRGICKALLVNLSVDDDFSLEEFDAAATLISETHSCKDEPDILVGLLPCEKTTDEAYVSIIATGIEVEAVLKK